MPPEDDDRASAEARAHEEALLAREQLAFGAQVQRLRSDLGVTQTELSLRTGIHRHYLSDVETGRRNPSIRNVFRIAHALGLPPYRLFQFDA
ncbi:MAG TPA: helix-turn-helix transcriptional regulator [Chloroflexota bacterium]|nr:helix-turn-helix transcriptional regulator [Chloroflexota bacterium]